MACRENIATLLKPKIGGIAEHNIDPCIQSHFRGLHRQRYKNLQHHESSQVRFENKNIFFYFGKRSSPLQRCVERCVLIQKSNLSNKIGGWTHMIIPDRSPNASPIWSRFCEFLFGRNMRTNLNRDEFDWEKCGL
jgi:hypothetical protein